MRQDSFSDAAFEKSRKKTRKEQFLVEMETIITRKELTEVIEPFYPKPKGAEVRDPEMRSTQKYMQWLFAKKAHMGVINRTELVHSAVASSANVGDSQLLPHMLDGENTRGWGHSAYSGQRKAIADHAPLDRDLRLKYGI